MSKIYRVITSFEMLVLANSPDEAKMVARARENEADAERSQAIRSVFPVDSLKQIPCIDQVTIPWGSEDDKPLCEILPE